MSSGAAQLRSLLALITSATEDAISEYEIAGHDIPSLNTVEPHPADSELPSPKLKKSIQILEGACHQLCTTLARPGHTMVNRSMAASDPACLRVVIHAGIADHLAEHPSGLHLSALAAKSGLEQGKLASIMRLLATQHCFQEVKPDVFANNRLSLMLLSSNEISDAIELKTNELHMKSALNLYNALTDPVYGPTYASNKSPLMYAMKQDGFDGTFYEWLKEQPGRTERFARAMGGFAKATGHMCIVEEFPWKDLPPGSTFCDLGGGTGNISIALARKYSHLKFVLQDLPLTIETAVKFWREEYPEAIDENRITFVPVDFFKQRPAAGLDIYYLRQVVHNWSDAENIILLKNLRQAMGPNSRVFIDEYIVRRLDPKSTVEETEFLAKSPEPLLPNFGAGNLRPYTSDISMLTMCNAKERLLDEFIALCKAADMEFVRVWDFSETAIIEFRPV